MPLLDARNFEDGAELSADLCIIGGGPMGLCLADALRFSNLSIILIESGGENRSQSAESLSSGEAVCDRYAPLSMYRRRMLGGASTIWGGRCVPYDPIDFDDRSYVPNSGWPLSFDEIWPYYERATALAQAGKPVFDSSIAFPNAPALLEGLNSKIVLTNNMERFSLPTNFWKLLRSPLLKAANIRVVVNASCTNLLNDRARGVIETARLCTLENKKLKVRAKKFVVAAGGIESYRLLANSNEFYPNGIGNEFDVLGRYFMSHIEGSFMKLKLAKGRRAYWNFDIADDGTYTRRRLSISPEIQRQHRLLNAVVRLHHESPANPLHRDPILSSMFLAKNFILAEYRNKITMVERSALDLMDQGPSFWVDHVLNIARGLPELSLFLARWVWRRNLKKRRIPYVVLPSRDGRFALDFNSEQVPAHDSRIMLSEKVDRLGVRLVNVDWKINELDVISISKTFRLIDEELRRCGVGFIDFGQCKLEDKIREEALPIGGHHLGAARMHSDPRKGVVDADLRVHGVSNLFIASTAVLPTSGHANPTLTTLALTLRLADKLKSF